MEITLVLAQHCDHALGYDTAERQVLAHFCKLEFSAGHEELPVSLQVIAAIYNSSRVSRGRVVDESEHTRLNRNLPRSRYPGVAGHEFHGTARHPPAGNSNSDEEHDVSDSDEEHNVSDSDDQIPRDTC
jgi:hypothetical protein